MVLSEIRQEARSVLKGRWLKLCLMWFILSSINTIIISIFRGTAQFVSFLILLAIGGPFEMGITIVFLNICNQRQYKIRQLFEGFKDFNRSTGSYLLKLLFVFLWSILLIIPGIIAAYSYSMAFFILAEDQKLSVLDALKKSKQIMLGHKTELLYLEFSIIALPILLLFILYLWVVSWFSSSLFITTFYVYFYTAIFTFALLTIFIGCLLLESYMFAAVTIFYKRIKGEAEVVAEPINVPEPPKEDIS